MIPILRRIQIARSGSTLVLFLPHHKKMVRLCRLYALHNMTGYCIGSPESRYILRMTQNDNNRVITGTIFVPRWRSSSFCFRADFCERSLVTYASYILTLRITDVRFIYQFGSYKGETTLGSTTTKRAARWPL